MCPPPSTARLSFSRRSGAHVQLARRSLHAAAALALVGGLGACDDDGSAAERTHAPRLDVGTSGVASMTVTEFIAAQAAKAASADSSIAAGLRLSVGVDASLAPSDDGAAAFSVETTPAYTTFADAAALAGGGTVAFTTDFEQSGPGAPGDPYVTGGVTFRSAMNVIIAPPTFLLRSKAIFNNYWTPVQGTLDSAAMYTMFGANLTVASRDGTSSPVSVQITTNRSTYTFADLAVPRAADGFAYFGISLASPGEYITGFRFDTRGEGWAVGVDDVVVGHGTRANQAPVVSAGGPYAGVEGQPVALSASGSLDPDGDAITFAWDLDGDGEYDDADGVTASRTFGDEGAFSVGVQATDANGAIATATAAVTVANVAPTATAHAPATVPEGSPIHFSVSNAVDVPADLPGLRYGFDCSGANPPSYGAFDANTSVTCATSDDGARVVRAKVVDEDGGATEYAATVAVSNVAPTVGAVSAPIDPVLNTSAVTVSASFADPGAGDTFTGEVRWDESGSFEPATISGSTVSASKLLPAGVYTVTLRVRDDDGGVGERTTTSYVVVYDPAAGFVTGGGWITYDGSACSAICRGVAGRAEFGFVSRDDKGATTPKGTTRFEFHAGALTFMSTSYDWLVVAGDRAQFKGVGTINGGGSYGFLLTAVDGSPDTFRIKIWDRATGDESDPLFDNGPGSALDKVGGNGSIVIHSR